MVFMKVQYLVLCSS